jgi:hypothetical protein
MAAETVDAGYGARTEEGTGRFNDLNITGAVIQARLLVMAG